MRNPLEKQKAAPSFGGEQKLKETYRWFVEHATRTVLALIRSIDRLVLDSPRRDERLSLAFRRIVVLVLGFRHEQSAVQLSTHRSNTVALSIAVPNVRCHFDESSPTVLVSIRH